MLRPDPGSLLIHDASHGSGQGGFGAVGDRDVGSNATSSTQVQDWKRGNVEHGHVVPIISFSGAKRAVFLNMTRAMQPL